MNSSRCNQLIAANVNNFAQKSSKEKRKSEKPII
jgi:hypothetical protein